ncbi:MAG: hypothetical protein NUV92_04085 [Ignavibacteria bacterium]|jgi:hypothetical protein|nr:hypothetical protein [Ignavibacteria bacterium]MDH7526682.1 hypothetical protein [Ignavibacteria bacterium]
MKYLLIFLVLFTSCAKKQEQSHQEKEIKTTIKENISYVKAKVIEKNKISDINYTLKLLILESQNDENLPNFASENDTIVVSPSFYIDEKGFINQEDERNKNLLRLSYININDNIEVKLTHTLNKGWLILDFIKKL